MSERAFVAIATQEGLDRPRSPGPWGLFWRTFRRSPTGVAGGVVLALLYVVALLAPFLAPYGEEEIDREHFYHPPQRVEFRDARGHWTPWPHVRATRLADAATFRYAGEGPPRPLRLFVRGAPYRLAGVVPCDRHLFGVDAPVRFYLLGSDYEGRDVFSRLLYGAQVSLTVGLIGIAISFTLGLVVGGVSGYAGGWLDEVLMRFTEVLLSIPALYLLLALRSVFPAETSSRQVYLGIVIVLALMGWAALARVIRGMVLALRRVEYVTAAEALGMSRARVLLRHILPNTMSFVVVAATLSIPGYILGEVVLSFLGLGVQEPTPAWGLMLRGGAQEYAESAPWVAIYPGIAISLAVFGFNLFGDALRDWLDPKLKV